jgi:predicted transcriptional regulator
MAKRNHPAPVLSPLEHEVMQAVWSAGPCSVEAVHDAVSRTRDLKEVTTRTVLRRLEQKGHLQHDVEGRAYIYRAVEPSRNIAARAVRQLIDRFCNGSVEELVSGIVEAKVLSQAELARLEESVKARSRASTSSRKGR